MGWASHDTEVISLVTAPVHTAVRRGGRAVVLSCDAGTLLARGGRAHRKPAAALRNSRFWKTRWTGERIRARTAELGGRPSDVDDLNIVAVRYLPDTDEPAAPPDDAFSRDGQITKETICAVTLAALAPARVSCSGTPDRDRAASLSSGAAVCGLSRSVFRVRRATSDEHRRQRPRAFESTSRCAARRPVTDGAPTPAAIFLGEA